MTDSTETCCSGYRSSIRLVEEATIDSLKHCDGRCVYCVGDEGNRNLGGEVCPYSTPLKGFRVLRSCFLQRREVTGPSGHTSYLVKCTFSGYAKQYRTCPEYVDATRNSVNPEELLNGLP
jgi:hypothetical protein